MTIINKKEVNVTSTLQNKKSQLHQVLHGYQL